ncbi:MAG: hypothetical protein WA946_00395 [Nitrospirota bacterium]
MKDMKNAVVVRAVVVMESAIKILPGSSSISLQRILSIREKR